MVQWGEVPDTDKNGIILSYTINYKVTPEGNLQQSQVVNASAREVTLTGLNKNTKYEIQVFANTSKGGGRKSEPSITVQTNEDSKYTIAEVTAAAFMGRATNKSFCRLEILLKFLLIWSENISSTDGKRHLALNITFIGRFANVLFGNVLMSDISYVLGQYSYFFRLICD